MSKKIGFIFLFICLINLVFSQTSNFRKEDTMRVNELNIMGRDSIIAGSYIKADSLISLALELAENVHLNQVYLMRTQIKELFYGIKIIIQKPSKINLRL
ncbi:MAG: hypothetical protein IPL10_16000 [Bacteroidetes bacterium]|nr:hypothetical protein [Bacteroidota bacterium]